MTLSTSIKLIKSATAVGVLLMAGGIFVMFSKFGNIDYLILGATIVLVAAIFLFGRKFWVRAMLRRSKYPGLLWGVCDLVGLLGGLDLDDPAVMDDLYKPTCDTETLLQDNELSSIIYPATTMRSKISSYGYIAAVAAAYGGWRMNNAYTTYCYLAAALLVIITTMVNARQGSNADMSRAPAYEFTPKGLLNAGVLIPWPEIERWKPGRDGPSLDYIVLETSGSFTDERAGMLPVGGMAVTVTDVYILLLHYKYKYGGMPK